MNIQSSIVVLYRLLRYGYFPKELPPPFSTKAFADAVRSGLINDPGVKYYSKPALHNLARPGNHRRVLAIPNPFNEFQVCNLLSKNVPDIRAAFDKSTISLSRPVADSKNGRAYITTLDGRDLARERSRVRAGSRYILKVDISRFYYSIYTHCLPWAINGKTWSKLNKKGGFANDLDLFLRNGQDQQT